MAAPLPSGQNVRDLLCCDWREEQQAVERGSMVGGARLWADVQLRYKIAPAEQFTPKSGATLDFDREINQTQNPLIGAAELKQVLKLQGGFPSIHLIPNHEDLLI